MTLDAKLPLFGEGEELRMSCPVGVMAREAGQWFLGSWIGDACPHGMREFGVSLVAAAADIQRLAGKKVRQVRAVGFVADGAAASPGLFRVIVHCGLEPLTHFRVTCEAEVPLFPRQKRTRLRGMGVVAAGALAAFDRRMDKLFFQFMGHRRMAGETELGRRKKGLRRVGGRDLVAAGAAALREGRVHD